MYLTLNMQQFDDITTYIPQRPPFVMVDKLLSVTDTETISELKISDINLFTEDGLFYESGIIENIAQTVAAGSGFRTCKSGEKPTIGMIGSIKKLAVTRRPKSGTTLFTTIHVITELENALVVEGTVSCNNENIASCQMNIFLIKNL
jgi:predicted hotdog family 3-hydroxylacyl-ACP dehydratase